MKWEGNRQSENVEDRRSARGGGGLLGGRSIGVGTIVLALIGWGVFGINPLTTIGLLSGSGAPQTQQAPAQRPPQEDRQAAFVATVLASTEDVWGSVFQQGGARYQPPKLVLFRGSTPTACGMGQSAMGPFYCPGDRKVYLDMEFRHHEPPIERGGRVCPCVCDCARGRPPCANFAGGDRQGR